MGDGTLVYDGGCGFCRRTLGWARRLGVACEMRPADGRLDAVEYVEGGPDGRTWTGHEAVARALRTSTYAVVRLAGRLLGSRPVAPLGRRAYAWVAANRHRFRGVPAE